MQRDGGGQAGAFALRCRAPGGGDGPLQAKDSRTFSKFWNLFTVDKP
jgi:hypothetical protein